MVRVFVKAVAMWLAVNLAGATMRRLVCVIVLVLASPGLWVSGAVNITSQDLVVNWGLTVFGWGLADYPEENVLLLFKTDAKLTLELYNVAVRAGIPVGLVVEERRSPPAYLIGFSQLTLPEVKSLYAQALRPRDSRYVTAPLEGVIAALEEAMGVTLDDVVLVLHELARAEREGKPEKYRELTRTPALQALVRLLLMVEREITLPEELFYVPRVRTYLLALARKIAREIPLEPPPSLAPTGVVRWIVGWALGRAVDLLLNWVWDYLRGEVQPRFARLIVDHRAREVRIAVDDPLVQEWNWSRVWEYIRERLPIYGVPDGLKENIIRAVYSDLRTNIAMFWNNRDLFSDFEREWLGAASAIYYSYHAYKVSFGFDKHDNLQVNSPWAPAFRHMVALVHMAVTKALRKIDPRLEGRDLDPQAFRFCNVAWHGKTEASFVLMRKVKDEHNLNHDRVDHVIARYVGRDEGKPLSPLHSIEQEVELMVTALNRLRNYTTTYTPLPGGLNVAAVILPTLAGEELERVREFVNRLVDALPYEELEHPNRMIGEHVAEAGFVIWKEYRNGKLTVVFRCIERRGAPRPVHKRLTDEEKVEIVRALLLPWERDLPIVEDKSGEGTSADPRMPTEPPVVVGVSCPEGRIFSLWKN